MISISEEDRDVLQFTRVVFRVASNLFLLNATLQHHLNRYFSSHPEIVRQLSKSIYVDDAVNGAGNEDKAYRLYSTCQSKLYVSYKYNHRPVVQNESF